ncbi:NAD(P)/FAD-dependent oxidoreductase [Caulobacter sp. 17J80-11]|uniref:NAD(P)/FAD-dependent oxidoreductase n=1 Tax=Caulobacter sp. 17J80-11 TaxID=2763502 RepID=UPI00165356B7|nr:NAD(P)/FAD-dependent oxidoreductase [Caulobacter sp. 17J80-11]
MADRDWLDCVVIGAGPAGLSAAVYLARFRRRFVLVHDGSSRAAWIPRTRNLPGYPDGIEGPDLLAGIAAQARRHGAELREARVETLEIVEGGFAVGLDGATLHARTVLLATGVKDAEPDLPDVFGAVQRGLIRICPICDAFEAVDSRVGVIGAGEKGAREALFLKTYTDKLTLLHVGAPANLKPEHRACLAERRITVIDTPIDAVELEGDRIVAFSSAGHRHVFDTVYSALGATPQSLLAEKVGARTNREGCLEVDAHQQTSVSGLYAAGDLVKGLNQIVVAMADAVIASTAIHNRLREAEGLVAPWA